MFENHVFQFDFLNDDFLPQNPDVVVEPVETTKKTMKSKGKIPDDLYEILADEEKRKKLVIYINPPYAEVSSQKITTEGKKSKAGVNNSCIHDLYFYAMGVAARELYIQFLARIFFEIKGFIIGEFSKLKLLQGASFEQFRNYFTAKLEKSFIVPSWTFDNVRGKFPIGFFIWNTNAVIEPVKMTKNSNESGFDKLNHRIVADVFDTENKFISVKNYSIVKKNQVINNWISKYKISESKDCIGFLDGINGNAFQRAKPHFLHTRHKLLDSVHRRASRKQKRVQKRFYVKVFERFVERKRDAETSSA